VVGLILVSIFMPAQQVSIEGIGTLSFETKVTLSVGSEAAYASPGWLSGWTYRRAIDLSPATSIADYQVLVTLNTSTMGNPYANVNTDGSDIRFTGSDEVTLQDYWIESWDNTGDSKIWVEVKTSGTTTIYMYYGNAGASSESSKENTMGIVDVQVGADADDGEEDGRVLGTHSWKTGGYYGDNAAFLGYYASYNSPFEIAWRFDNITASGKAIDGCKIILHHNNAHTESAASNNTTLYGIDEADPVAFSATDNTTWPSNRNRTTASVSWNPPPEIANGTNELAESPEIKTIIQELLDSYTYTGTQAMAFYWRVESTSTWWRNYDLYGAPSAPKLHIEYRKYTSPEPSTTVGSEETGIVNAPTGKNFGTVVESSAYWSKDSAPTFPLDDSECFFTVTNYSSDAVDISISATNFIGGAGWALAGSPGAGIVTLKAGKSGDNDEADMVTLTTGDKAFISGLAASENKAWELKLETGTFTDSAQKTSIITLTATFA